jgi:hypothetical protein
MIMLIIIVVTAVVLTVLAACELFFNLWRARFSVKLPRHSAVVTHEYLKRPVYIMIKEVPTHNLGTEYIEEDLDEHLISKIVRDIKQCGCSIKEQFHTKMPITKIYGAIGKTDELLDELIPLTAPKHVKYKVYKHRAEKAETFLYGDRVYFV